MPAAAERPRSHRRGIAGGVLLGLAAALVVEAWELLFIARVAWGYFDGPREFATFAGCALGVAALGGVVIGAVAGLLGAAVAGTAEALSHLDGEPGRQRVARWRSRLLVALGAWPVALVCAQIFRGPRAQRIPGHDLYAIAIGLAALAGFYVALQQYQRLAHAIEEGRVRSSLSLLAALALVTSGLGAYVADQRVLPRLYPFFHRSLGALTVALVGLGLGLLYLRLSAASPRAPQWARPPVALVAFALALVSGLLALTGFEHSRALRSLALERSLPLARLLRAASFSSRDQPAAEAAPEGPAPGSLPDPPKLGDRDVFLITVDAMRADRLADRTAPFMAGLARTGTRFERAYAQVPHTSFSVATLLTGKQVYSLSTLGLDAGAHQTLAEVLRRERYQTAAFYPPSVFFIDHDRLKSLEASHYGFEYVKYEYLAAEKRTDQVIRFLEEARPAHALVWVHYLEPHEPYEPHSGFTKATDPLIALYDGEVGLVDREVARLCAYLRAHRPRALVVLAADHGEEFGEHGGQYHGTTLYDEQLRVPLVFATLDGSGLGRHVVRGPVGLVDVTPTLLSLLGVVPLARMRGRDLSPWLSEPGARDSLLGPEFAEIERKKMIALGDEKLICDLETDSCELYDLGSDPGEHKNLADDRARLAPLRARLAAWMAEQTRFERPITGDPATRRLLERGRLGDRTSGLELLTLVGAADQAVRREAARLVARLPPDRALAPGLTAAARGASDRDVERWIEIALGRLGDPQARLQVARFIDEACDGGDRELCARAALALGEVDWLSRALEAFADDDRALEAELVRALGRSHDRRALDPLLIRLASVRTRLDVVQALGELGDPRALATLDRWAPAEPYVPVRAAMALVMGALAARPDAGALAGETVASLRRLAAVERESLVLRRVIAALAALAAPEVRPAARARVPSRGELWLVGDGAGRIEVRVGGEPRALAFDQVARLEVPRAGAVQIAGPAAGAVKWAYFRKTP